MNKKFLIIALLTGVFVFVGGGLLLRFVFTPVFAPAEFSDYPLDPPENSYSLLPGEEEREETAPEESNTASPQVAIVIDDLGWHTRAVPVLEDISVPLTMAVLPERPESMSLYRRWIDQFEFILHMPMEPEGYPDDDPGERALFTSMSREEIQQTLEEVLERYPRVVGMNNHMGSEFISYRPGMEAVMEKLSRRNLFFLDSNTTRESVAMDVAPEHNVPAVKNNVFLDLQTNKEHIRGQFQQLIKKAKEEGAAIGIGHIQSYNTALVLREKIPEYKEKGIEFVYLSGLVEIPRLQYQSPEGLEGYS